MAGKLVICPTPIGNLGDMPPRAAEALAAADVVFAEDTRVTGKLLGALGIEGKRLERLDENVIGRRADAVIQRVEEGQVVAYATDAGMPGVSDPGQRLVAAAREAGVPVETLPGPTAAATAYVTSGTLCPNFYFGGFFPRKDATRRKLLQSLAELDAALIFYESPHRLADALAVIAEVIPLRQVAVCRELTKLHEEVVRGSAPQVSDEFSQRESVKGEVVLVIDGPDEAEAAASGEQALDEARQRAAALVATGMRPKEVARQLSDELGVSRNDAYGLALEARDGFRGEA